MASLLRATSVVPFQKFRSIPSVGHLYLDKLGGHRGLLHAGIRQSPLFISHTSRLSLVSYPLSSPLLTVPFECSSCKKFHSRTKAWNLKDEDRVTNSSDLTTESGNWYLWPELSRFIEKLEQAEYFQQNRSCEKVVAGEELSDEFLKAVNACLTFAQENADALWWLSRRDIKVVVENVSPFLFEKGTESAMKMKSFLSDDTDKGFQADKPSTNDLMKYLISYASIITRSSGNYSHVNNRELVETSVRKLLNELADVVGGSSESVSSRSETQLFTGRVDHTSRPFGQKVEMKRGDWICPRCDFHNFARNMKCLECEEFHPKRHLTGEEWECPQCNFYNHGRNSVCLRCDCKKPGASLLWSHNPVAAPGYTFESYNGGAEKKSAEIEDIPQWFTKISQIENSTENSSSATKEDCDSCNARTQTSSLFEVASTSEAGEKQGLVSSYQSNLLDSEERQQTDKELLDIMPIHKGQNRFVISKKKDHTFTSPPVKGRAALEQAGSNNYVPFIPFPPDYFAKKDKPVGEASGSNHKSEDETPSVSTSSKTNKTHAGHATSKLHSEHQLQWKANSHTGVNSRGTRGIIDEATSYSAVDMGSKSADDMHKYVGSGFSNQRGTVKYTKSASAADNHLSLTETQSARDIWKGKSLEGSAVKEPDPLDMSEEAKAERWFRRVAQIKNISELSQIPDEDFPTIMPMRKGVNRFVVSKRKTPLQRRLTSSQYRRNLPLGSNDDPRTLEDDTR